MRKQYHFWAGSQGIDAWDVDRLIQLADGLPVRQVPVDSIEEVDSTYWFFGHSDLPTVRKVAEHAKLIMEADLSYPIILGWDGRVMDGMHRVARAVLDGRAAIDAVRLREPVAPDFPNCDPATLPYPERE